MSLRAHTRIHRASWHWHPRVRSGEQLTFGERAIDGLNAFFGSFKYLVWQTVVVIVWIALNSWHGWHYMWDGYPFILLNLVFSTQAAYAAPIILAAGIRADAKREAIAAETHDCVMELRQLARSNHGADRTD